MLIKVKDIGKNLGLRKTGEKYRLRLEEALESGDNIIADFEDVESLSSSFADEFLAKLFIKLGHQEFKKRIKLINVNEFNKIVIKGAIRDRVKEAA